MTYEQIWNTTEDLFNQNLISAKNANAFFGFNSVPNEITTKDGLIIKYKPKDPKSYEVVFSTSTKLIKFKIKKQIDKYELDIDGNNEGDMKHFLKYVRDWKLKNILE